MTYPVLPNIDPVIHLGSMPLQIGPLALRWYGLAYVVGIALAGYYANRLLKDEALWQPRKPPLAVSQLVDLVVWLAIGIVVGGRLGYVFIYNLPETLKNPLSIVAAWDGGMSFHGGFLGVVVAATIFSLRQKFSLPQILNVGDLLASTAPIGLFLVRLANFSNGELWGRVSHVPWAMVFCNEQILKTQGYCPAGNEPRHPSQLYEAGLEGVFLFVLALILGRTLKFYKYPGLVMGAFIAGYGIIRILLENVRNPDLQMPHYPFGLTMGMMLSVPMVLVGGYFIWRSVKTSVGNSAPN